MRGTEALSKEKKDGYFMIKIRSLVFALDNKKKTWFAHSEKNHAHSESQTDS